MQVVVSRVVLPGGAVYSVFIWLVVPVVVTSTCAETAAMCLFWCQLGYFVFGITYSFFTVPGGVPYFLVMMSFEVVSLVGVLWMHSCVVYLCDGELDVPVFAVTRWEMLH